MWSMYLIPESLRNLEPLSAEWVAAVDELQESELKSQILKWPHAARHDNLNFVFVDTADNANNPIDIANAEYETVDQLIAIIANALFAEDRSRAIHLTKSQAIELYAHVVWRLWCGRYDDKDTLESDHELFFGVGVDRRKSLESLKEQVREDIRAAVVDE